VDLDQFQQVFDHVDPDRAIFRGMHHPDAFNFSLYRFSAILARISGTSIVLSFVPIRDLRLPRPSPLGKQSGDCPDAIQRFVAGEILCAVMIQQPARILDRLVGRDQPLALVNPQRGEFQQNVAVLVGRQRSASATASAALPGGSGSSVRFWSRYSSSSFTTCMPGSAPLARRPRWPCWSAVWRPTVRYSKPRRPGSRRGWARGFGSY